MRLLKITELLLYLSIAFFYLAIKRFGNPHGQTNKQTNKILRNLVFKQALKIKSLLQKPAKSLLQKPAKLRAK